MPETNNNLNLPNEKINKGAKTQKFGLKELATAFALAVSLGGSPEANAVTPNDEAKTELATALQSSPEDDNDKLISKEEMTINFIKNNVFINGQSVKDLNIIHFKDDQYRITKYLSEHDTPLDIYITFTYKDNNILINKVEPEQYKEEGQFINPYGYLLSYPKNNKHVDIRIVPNPNAGKQIIQDQEKNNTITTQTLFENNPKFENTQLTELNNLKLGKEIFEEGNNYYKEVFAVVNGKYVKIFKVYFDEKGNIDTQKTRQEIKNVKILGIDVNFTIDDTGKTSLDLTSIKDIENHLLEDRAALTNLLNNPNFASNQDFPGLNKVNGKHSINTGIIKRYDIENRIYALSIADGLDLLVKISGEGKEIKKTLVDCYGNSIENKVYIKDGRGYKISIVNGADKELIIHEFAVSKKIPSETLPKYSGNPTISNVLNNDNNNILLTKTHVITYDSEGNLLIKLPINNINGKTEIPEEYSVKLDVLDFYNHYSKFELITNQIKDLSNQLGLTELDIKAALQAQIQKDNKYKDLNLVLQNTVKAFDPKSGDIYYCKLENGLPNIGIYIDNELEETVKKILNNALEILRKMLQAENGDIWKSYSKNKAVKMTNYAAGQAGANDVVIPYNSKMTVLKGGKKEKEKVETVWNIDGQKIVLLRNMNKDTYNLISEQKIVIGGTEYKPLCIDQNGNIRLKIILGKE